MNANAVARNYGCLTPEERFRLIFAASGRGDEAERDRLGNAGKRIKLAMPDHFPFGQAFQELALLMFIELVEDAACYFSFFTCPEEQDGDGAGVKAKSKTATGPMKDDARKRPAWQRTLELALAAGFVLRTKADGWKLFCERLNVPPFLLWEGFPGLERLQCALALTEKAAFTPDGILRWLNRIRPAGESELTEAPLTVAGVADDNAKTFRTRAQWWDGR